jgi:ATP-dependent helicase HrpB
MNDPDPPIDRRRLAETAIASDPRMVHIARKRKRHIAWSNGGTELALARESAATRKTNTEAILVLESRAFGLGQRDTRILATCAMPIPLPWLVGAKLGRDRLAGVSLEGKKVVARIERVHAKKVIDEREEIPTGALAREAMRDLVLRGTLFRKARDVSRERLVATALAAGLDLGVGSPPSYDDWLLVRLEELGVESGRDVALLSAEDLTFPEVGFEVRHILDDRYPREVSVGDATYRVEYDVPKRRVTLYVKKGSRKKPPPISWLPRFEGFHITIEAGGTMHVLR